MTVEEFRSALRTFRCLLPLISEDSNDAFDSIVGSFIVAYCPQEMRPKGTGKARTYSKKTEQKKSKALVELLQLKDAPSRQPLSDPLEDEVDFFENISHRLRLWTVAMHNTPKERINHEKVAGPIRSQLMRAGVMLQHQRRRKPDDDAE